MTSEQLFEFLYDWIDMVLNTQRKLNVPIIESHQDAPRLKTTYIVIEYAADMSKTGRATLTDPASAPDDPEDEAEQEEGNIFIIEDYKYVLDLREENGSGNYLKYIIDSIENPEVQEYFFNNKIAFMGNGNIQPVPSINDNKWIKQAVVEIQLGLPTYNESSSGSWIDSVDYTASIRD
jgi:hypothetical protein